MKSNYKRIGDFIQEINVRNTKLDIKNLLGINIDKFFMPSVANIVGTDMTAYKIVKNGQFACNRMHVGRDKRLPVALYNGEDDIMVSPAYNVFEIIDKEVIDPEYLMMWFLRSEFDRSAWFYTDADVRGGLNWKDFCNMKLPVPSIAKQKEIVKEYNVVVDRINTNNQLIRKLEETAQAIYKQWFVDFEFPNENGKSYRSDGGEMEFDKQLDKEIPKGWKVDVLSGVADYLNGLAMQNYASTTQEYIPVIKIRELSQGYTDEKSDRAKSSIQGKYIINNGDVIFSWSGTLKVEIWTGGIGGLNQHLFKVTSEKYERWFCFLWTKYHLKEFIRIAEGKAVSMGHIKREHLDEAKVLVPLSSQMEMINIIMIPIFENITNYKIESAKLLKISDLFLSKLATMEG